MPFGAPGKPCSRLTTSKYPKALHIARNCHFTSSSLKTHSSRAGGHAARTDSALYSIATLPAATSANAAKGAYILGGGRAAYRASVRSIKAQVAAMRAMGYSKKKSLSPFIELVEISGKHLKV